MLFKFQFQERIEDGEEVEMQMESDDDDETLPMVREGEKDRAKDNNQVQDMEEDSSSEDEISPPGEPQKNKSNDSMQPPPLPPTPGNVVVKKGYDPKQHAVKASKSAAPDEYLVSPITGEKIPAHKVQEHMRIGLLDPRWVEQRDKHNDKLSQETVFAPGTAIEAQLKQLAERRTDIFGVGDEETVIGKKIGEEDKKKDDKVTWDGHTSSVEAATRAARANITLEEQIHQIHKVMYYLVLDQLNFQMILNNLALFKFDFVFSRSRDFYLMKKKKRSVRNQPVGEQSCLIWRQLLQNHKLH